MQPNKIMYIDLADPLPKSYAPKKGEEMNRSTYGAMRYTFPHLKIIFPKNLFSHQKHCILLPI